MPEPIRRFLGVHRFLSNFYPAPVVLSFVHEGTRHAFDMPSVENAFQAAKVHPKHPSRVELVASFLTLTAPEAKKKGKHVPCRDDWDEIRIQVMYRLVKQKFSLPHLRERLLATGETELIEGNHWGDRFWGVDLDGEGENHLGKTLMLVRSELRRGQV